MNAETINGSPRIAALQGLRTCSFLAIFISHTVDGYASFGAVGVSVFFILSGFLMSYRYLPRQNLTDTASIWGNLRFAAEKMSRLYALHLLTMLITLFWMLGHPEQFVEGVRFLPEKMVLNCFLLQSWVPKSSVYFALNSVSWYLSTAMFTYFIFPWLLKVLRRVSGKGSVLLAITFLIVLEGVLSFAVGFWGRQDSADYFSLHWITYVCPLFRCIDFSIGAFAGRLFLLYRDRQAVTWRCSALTTCGEVLTILALYGISRLYTDIPGNYRYTVVFAIPSALLVLLLAYDRGYVSRLLEKKPFQVVGGLTGAAFLIHMPVIRICRSWLETVLPQIRWYVSVLLLLMITLALAFAWDRLQRTVGNAIERHQKEKKVYHR